jgi:hypothetical protein
VSSRTEARYAGAEAFLKGESFKKNNIIVANDTIYSYGRHFPMAVKIAGDRIAVSTEKYSVTTSRHQSALFSTLRSAGYAPTEEMIGKAEVWAR